jgi:colicin import membrane protein
MKQYLWAGVALLVVGAHASDNPFELKENFGKLDQDQAVLLDDLKRLAELKELAEEAALDEDPIAEIEQDVQEEAVVPLEKENENLVIQSLDEVVDAPDASSEDRLNTMRENALNASKKAFESKDSSIEEPTKELQDTQKEAEEKQILLDAVQQKEEELKKAKAEEAQASNAKEEAERREVAAYEKQRAEKLAKEKAEAEALEKEALAQKEARAKRLAKKEAQKNQAKADAAAEQKAKVKVEKEQIRVAKVTKTDKEDTQTTNRVDINVTREKIEAKISADKAYEDAVREMSQED